MTYRPAPANVMSSNSPIKWGNIRAAILAFIVVAITLFPFLWMALTSLKPDRELYSTKANPLTIREPTFLHYINLFSGTDFSTWMTNSLSHGRALCHINFNLCSNARRLRAGSVEFPRRKFSRMGDFCHISDSTDAALFALGYDLIADKPWISERIQRNFWNECQTN